MLVINPKIRWPIQKVVESLAKILDHSRQPGDGTGVYYVERSQAISLTNNFPPLWDDECRQRIGQYWSTQPSTQCDLTSTFSAHLGGPALPRGPKDLTDAVGSKHDMEKPVNAFTDYSMTRRSSCPVHVQRTRSATIAAGRKAPKDGDILQKGQNPENNLPESLETEIMGTPRQEHSLQQNPMCVSDQILDPSPDMDLLRVIGNISVSQKPGLPSTPATSHRLASTSKAHSTCTEEPRPSMSSRTDESILNLQECSQASHHSDAFQSIAREDMPKPEVLANSLPAGDTTLNGAKKMETNRGCGATETRSSRKYGLIIWRELRSLQKKGFRSILNRGRWLFGRDLGKGGKTSAVKSVGLSNSGAWDS